MQIRALRPGKGRNGMAISKSTLEKTRPFPLWDFVILFTFVCAMGFPGKWTKVLGGSVETLLTYLPWVLQLGTMLLSSSQSFFELKLLDLKKKYIPIDVLLAAFFGISMLDSRFSTPEIISCVRFTTMGIYAMWLVDHYEVEHIVNLAYYAQFVITCLMLLFMVLFSRYSYSNENGEVNFVGMFPTKNTCGEELSFGFVICGLLLRLRLDEKKPLPLSFFITVGGLIFLLLMTKAVGALICALVPLSYIFLFEKRMRKRLPLGVIYPLVSVGFLIAAMTILPLFNPVFDALGKDVTLTNRTDIWTRIIYIMSSNNSFFGYGFQLFWYNDYAVRLFKAGFPRGGWLATVASSCHNTLLEMWCDLGLIGLALYFFSLLRAYSRISELSEKQYCFTCMILLWFMMMGLTERLFSTFNFQSLFFFLAMAIACDLPDQRRIARRAVKPRNRQEAAKEAASPG